MKKWLTLLISLILIPLPVFGSEYASVSDLNGEWWLFTTEDVPNADPNVLLKEDGDYQFSYSYGDETKTAILHPDGTMEAPDGTTRKYPVVQLEEGGLLLGSEADAESGGMLLILPSSATEEDRTAFRLYAAKMEARQLLYNGKIYTPEATAEDSSVTYDFSTSGDSAPTAAASTAAAAPREFYLDGTRFYLIANNRYNAGTITGYGENLFIVEGLSDVGNVVYVRTSRIGLSGTAPGDAVLEDAESDPAH